MSGHFKRPVVSETCLNYVTHSSLCDAAQAINALLLTCSDSSCLTQGSCYDPAYSAVVSTGSPRCSRTWRSTGCSRSEPGEEDITVFWYSNSALHIFFLNEDGKHFIKMLINCNCVYNKVAFMSNDLSSSSFCSLLNYRQLKSCKHTIFPVSLWVFLCNCSVDFLCESSV